MNVDVVIVICITILIILFGGKPDLMNSIIQNNKCLHIEKNYTNKPIQAKAGEDV